MSTPINDGGPAFPLATHGMVTSGMTLRDYFAGQALAGYLAAVPPHDNASEEVMGQWCYRNADAMLAARYRKEGAT